VCKKVYGVNGKAERKRLAWVQETLAPSESSASERGISSLLTRIGCPRCFGSTSSFTLLRSGLRSSEIRPLLSITPSLQATSSKSSEGRFSRQVSLSLSLPARSCPLFSVASGRWPASSRAWVQSHSRRDRSLGPGMERRLERSRAGRHLRRSDRRGLSRSHQRISRTRRL